MLQVICSYSRQNHPCLSCNRYGTDEHPDCIETCDSMNTYLISIGELPHKPPEEIPESFKGKLYRGADHYTTPEQTKELLERIEDIQRATGWNYDQISLAAGMTRSYISQLKRGLMRKMMLSTYKKFMGIEY